MSSLEALLPRWNWQANAKCVGRYVEYDYDLLPASTRKKNEIAATLCDGCPVLRECALLALHFGDRDVIRAGLAVSEDSKTFALQRQQLAAIAGVEAPKQHRAARDGAGRPPSHTAGQPCAGTCGRKLTRPSDDYIPDGYAKHYGRGLCGGCYNAFRTWRRKTEPQATVNTWLKAIAA